ncbi:MAG TPA: sigma-70 family RNA polymerase sigma factor [Thermomicrobiales bacterium]|nr:sigma-70 family RNA polymerase sigma factor [Thermomicrobiales bacterium]
MAATTATIGITPDEALVQASYAGDEQAFEQLFLRYYPKVYRVAVRIVGNREDAEEVALDAMSQLHRRKFDPARGDNVAGWLYRTATNMAFNRVRARNRRRGWWQRLVRREGRPGLADDPQDSVLRDETAEEVRRALSGVPERQRDAIILRASGLSYAEIAESIGVQPSSVGTLIARGERKLREMMAHELESEAQ